MYLTVQFIRSLPRELDKAATVDGCGPISIYTRIILPLTTPAIVTTTIFYIYLDLERLFSASFFILAA